MAIYYVDGSATDDSGTGAQNSPKKYIGSGINLMSAGDTLYIADGTYTGVANMIGIDGNVTPVSGISATQRTKIYATNIGQVIIDGQYSDRPFACYDTQYSRNYLHISGIHFKRGTGGVFYLGGSYNYVNHCGFEDGDSSAENWEYPIAAISEGGYNLVEDCWVWGRGRYGLYTSSVNGGTNRTIFRRCVVRHDSVPSYVCAAFRFYDSSHNMAQNCFAIDGVMADAAEASVFTMGGSSSVVEEGHVWDSCIALNYRVGNYCPGFMTERVTYHDSGDALNWTNGVIWYGDFRGMTTTSNAGEGIVNITNSTIGACADIALRNNSSNPYQTWNVDKCLVQIPSGGTGFDGMDSVTTTYYYLNGGSRGDSVGTALTAGQYNASLMYLPRIEAGSVVGNASAGANILYQVGVTGTYHGQTGYNTTTANELWPLPNEKMWVTKMNAYTASGPGGDRGFATDAQILKDTPLTDYIWEYLGNAKPDIYGDISNSSSPSASGDGGDDLLIPFLRVRPVGGEHGFRDNMV